MANRFEKYSDLEDIENGIVEIEDTTSIKCESFLKEKDLVEYVVDNIDLFARDILNDKVKSFEVDRPIHKRRRLEPRGRRIDLYIEGENKTYIIEFKNPSFGTESRAAIGQILDYGREFPYSEKELIIITSKFDMNTAKTIKYYNLPIRYIFMSKEKSLEYEGETKWEQNIQG